MKVLLYTESLKAISKSGLGKAIKHQMKASILQKFPIPTIPTSSLMMWHISISTC